MPKSFRGYDLGEKIGAGGMSTLYTGTQKTLDRRVAVKLLHPGLAEDASFIARFEREARAASSLGHSNIVTVIDFGSEEDVYFIVMEYIDGADLAHMLQEVKPWPPELGLVVLEEIAYGLEAAHAGGVIHRDIKPGNVLLSREGEVKIVDFGLARQRQDVERLAAITLPGLVMGTPAYMSPEQTVGRETDHRTDIFSLGCLAYELFTGQKAFGGATHSEIRAKLIGEDPPPMRGGFPLINADVEALVNRMLEKDPDKRFQTMTTLLEAIHSTMEGLESPGSIFRLKRRSLADFAKAPAEFVGKLVEGHVKLRLERGSHLRNLGLDKIDDALDEFRLALALDPANDAARTAIRELESARQEEEAEDATAALTDATQALDTPRTVRPGSGSARRWWWALAPLLILALVLGLRGLGGGAAAGELAITTTPTGAQVLLRRPGGAAFEPTGKKTGCQLAGLEAGTYDIRLELDGHAAKEVRVTLESGKRRDLAVALVANARTDTAQSKTTLALAAQGKGDAPRTREPTPKETLRVLPSSSEESPPKEQEVTQGRPSPRQETKPRQVVERLTPEVEETARPTPPPPAADGYFLVLARPYADIYLDGTLIERQGRRRLIRVSPEDEHRIELRHPSFGERQWTSLSVAPGETLALRHRFQR